MNLDQSVLLLTIPLSQIVKIIASALGCGLLIGLERERNQQKENQQSFAGLRSFALCALFGALCFMLGTAFSITGSLIIAGIVMCAIYKQEDDLGITTELVFLITFFIGGLCTFNLNLAAGLAVTLTILLMTKHSMHHFAGKWITEAEFRDGIFLLALILIALPLIPNRPLLNQTFNPYITLKLLILILIIQSLAHIAKRLLSSKNAMILSSIASGFVSSTATVANLGIEARKDQSKNKSNAGAALLSCIATLIQLLIIIASINLAWVKVLLIPCLLAILILIIPSLWLIKDTSTPFSHHHSDSKMFSLKDAVIVAITLTLIQTSVTALTEWLGNTGLITGTLLASLFEIHGAMATVVMQGPPTNLNILNAVILGLAAHAIAKSINAAITGGFKFFIAFAPAQILHMTILIMSLLWIVQTPYF